MYYLRQFTYDDQGRKISQKASWGGTDATTWQMQYNDQGLVSVIIGYDSAGQETGQEHYFYDANGQQIYYNQVSIGGREEVTYNDRGLVTSVRYEGEMYGSPYTSEAIFDYDAAGNRTHYGSAYQGRTPEFHTVYTYDDQNRLIRQEDVSGFSYTEYLYDTEGRCTMEAMRYSDGSTSYITTYTYDGAGRPLMINYSAEGVEDYPDEYYISYVYNDRGELICEYQYVYGKMDPHRIEYFYE